jgi:NTP pyrophosphatase (non-canonical NTP hydrolase)
MKDNKFTDYFDQLLMDIDPPKNSTAAIGGLLNMVADTIHNFNAKWWHDLDTGEPIEITNDLVLSKIALIHSELSEAVEGQRKGLMDDHLPNRKMIEVELADSIIRTFDLAKALDLDIGGALVEKCVYNLTRADHSIEHRKSENGKKV